ncbi:MAG: hypothetical protein U0Q15_07850 [Kineosporiaceae bacterium]
MTPIPIPPRDEDPFTGLVLDQEFIASASIREAGLPSAQRRLRTATAPDRLAVVRARVAGSSAPQPTRRSLTITALAAAALVGGLALVGPGRQALSHAWSQRGSDAVVTRTVVVDDVLEAPAVDAPAGPAAGATTDGVTPTSGPVLVDGQLADPFRDPFADLP